MKIAIGSWCDVQCGGYAFEKDAKNVQWYITKFTGWFDGPPMRAKFDSRPQFRGGFDAPVYADSRVIVIEGKIAVDNPIDLPALEAARAQTQALLADGSRALLVVTDDYGQALQAQVRLSDKTTVDPVGAVAYTFSLQLTATDPIRYGANQGNPRQVATGMFMNAPGGLNFDGTNVSRTNQSTNPALDNDDTGWFGASFSAPSNFTAARTSVTGYSRTHAYRVTMSAAGDIQVVSPAITVSPGTQFTQSFYVRSSAAISGLELSANYVDFTDTYHDLSSTTVNLAANTVTQVHVSGIAPPDAVQIAIYVYASSVPSGGWLEATQHLVEMTPSVGSYFDGASTNGQWEGTPGNSASSVSIGGGGLGFDLDFGSGGQAGLTKLFNHGNASVYPTFTIVGPADHPTVTCAETGAAISYQGSLGDGESLIINCATKRVLLQNTASRRNLTSPAQFSGFEIPANGEITVAFRAQTQNATGTLTATWADGWW